MEAFNLKAAIEYSLANHDAAKEALSDMPPRGEDELDPVTLHNQVRLGVARAPIRGSRWRRLTNTCVSYSLLPPPPLPLQRCASSQRRH